MKQKLQNFGHLMRRTDSLEKTLMLGRIEGRRRRGAPRLRRVPVAPPGDLPDPGMGPEFPALQAYPLPSEPWEEH